MKRYGHEKFETLLRESTVHAARAPLAQRRLASVRRCCVWRRRFSLFCRIRGAALCARRFKRRSARGTRLLRASPWPRSIHRPCAARRTAERPGPTASACAPSRLRVGLSGPCRACVAAAAPAAALSERICPRFEQGKSLISDSDKQRIFQRLGQEKTALGSDYTQRRRRRRRADCGGRGEGGKGGGGSPDCRFTARHSHRRDAAVRRPRGAPRWRSKRRRLQRACLRARRRQRACMRADEVC